MGWTPEKLHFSSQHEQEVYVFYKASRLAPRLTQPPTQWAPEVLCSRVKQAGHEDDNLCPSTAKAVRPRNTSSIPSRNKKLSF
jgi:hypothetical protein